jgi:hypothetical protein
VPERMKVLTCTLPYVLQNGTYTGSDNSDTNNTVVSSAHKLPFYSIFTPTTNHQQVKFYL